MPLGYSGETKAFGLDMAGPIVQALRSGAYHWSASNTLWGARASICIPLENQLFLLGASLGVFAHKPGYNHDCTVASPVAPNGASAGQALKSEVAAFRIGDGEFISIPGEVFPFTFLRGFLGPQDMQTPADPLPPWLIPHMHAPFRFIDGLGEDMLGYLFPSGNAVGIPNAANLSPSDTDRFGCGHSDDSEATSAHAADSVGSALVRVLDAHEGVAETVVRGRYVLPGGVLSRDPLGGPELKCNVEDDVHGRAPAGPGGPAGFRPGCRPVALDVAQRAPANAARPRHPRLLRCPWQAGVARRVLVLAALAWLVWLAPLARADFPYAPDGLAPGVAPNEFSETADWKLAATPDGPLANPLTFKVNGQADELCGVRGMSVVDLATGAARRQLCDSERSTPPGS